MSIQCMIQSYNAHVFVNTNKRKNKNMKYSSTNMCDLFIFSMTMLIQRNYKWAIIFLNKYINLSFNAEKNIYNEFILK